MEVIAGNDIETAIRVFKRVVAKDGIHREIKVRCDFPNLRDRKKFKALEAERRRKKRERRRDS